MVNDLKELIDFLSIKRSCHIGHSMGVNITLEFAYQYPNLIDGMVLISGTSIPPHDIMFNTNYSHFIFYLIEKLSNKSPKLLEKFWKSQYRNPLTRYLIRINGFNLKQTSDSFVRYYLKKIGELSPSLFIQLLKEMKYHDILSKLEIIKTPTLVIGGSHDKVIPNYLQNIFLEYLSNATLYIVGKGSHVPQVDFPKLVNKRINYFIQHDLLKLPSQP